MRTAEEILRKSGHIFDAIEEAQTEAYNEAIKDAVLNAEVSDDGMSVNPDSILKLLK